jgi:hypothetical protein
VFALLDDVREDLRATGDIADWMATTTVCLPAKLHRPVLLEGARRNLHMRLPGLQRQVSSACGVTKASLTERKMISELSQVVQRIGSSAALRDLTEDQVANSSGIIRSRYRELTNASDCNNAR